ncbi:hypothetical protein FRB90_003322 [Tulasnella sp. 427]|nr:hypothetical protein FRB90_003322 [Tulasnella sp. 427]
MSDIPPNNSQELVFHGYDGAEAEEFIRSVKKSAKAAGKLRDNDWIVDEVSVALAGDALRWYIDLDEEAQSDWARLQRAIVRQYPRKVAPIPGPSEPNAVPTPAAAALHALAAPAIIVTPEKRFYIRIVFRGSTGAAFVTIKDGLPSLVPTSSPYEAIQVQYSLDTKQLSVTKGNCIGDCISLYYYSKPNWKWKGPDGGYTETIPAWLQHLPRPFSEFNKLRNILSWNIASDGAIRPSPPPPNVANLPAVDFFIRLKHSQNTQAIFAFLDFPSSKGYAVPDDKELLDLKLEEV